MDVLSSTGILTPDIRLVTSFESTRVAPGSASLFFSHSSEDTAEVRRGMSQHAHRKAGMLKQ
jgi:hypothetical protein